MPNPSSLSPLPAFLRGIEARAFVLIQCQCGDGAAALRALAAAEVAFAAQAASLPLPQWPLRFWSDVLRQPALISSATIEPPLAAMSSGTRAALLLRLVAGLDTQHAAQALGVAEVAYERAVERALVELARQGTTPQELHDALHARARALTAAQRDALLTVRDAALNNSSAAVTTSVAAGGGTAATPAIAWLRPAAWAGLVLASLAFVGTFVWSPPPALAPGQSQPLPDDGPTAAPALDDAAVVMHPDYAQLAAPADEAIAQRLALLSWIAAGAPPAVGAAAPPLQESATPESAGTDPDVEDVGAP